MRLLRGPSGDGMNELIERLREEYVFNPASPVSTARENQLTKGINSVMYNRLTVRASLNVLGEDGTKDALSVYNSKMSMILSKVLGRMPGAVGFDPKEDVDCANNNFVKFAGYLGLKEVSAEEGIEGFIKSLELDPIYL